MKIVNPSKRLMVPRHARQRKKPVPLVIYRSLDGEKGWEPVPVDEVPAFLKRPDIVRRMKDGEMAQLEKMSPYWYRAEVMAVH